MTETPWYILKCLSRREELLSKELLRSLGLHSYVPLEHNKIVRRGRSIEVSRPLVPGYLFVLGIGESVWRDIAETKHVMGWCTVGGKPAPIKDAEVGLIRAMERLHNNTLHARRTFKIGDRVRPKDGPFASIESLLQSVRGTTGTMEITMLGSVRTVTVPLENLEKIA